MVLNAVNTNHDPRLRNLANREVLSSLTLQQLLYYNLYFDAGWLIFQIAWMWWRYPTGLFFKDEDIVRTVFLILWLISEPLRMFSGWYGNLQENLPWLVIFLALCIMPQQGTLLYFYFGGFDAGPPNKAVQVAMWLMWYSEMVIVIYTIIRLYRRQNRQYYMFEYAVNKRLRFPDEQQAQVQPARPP